MSEVASPPEADTGGERSRRAGGAGRHRATTGGRGWRRPPARRSSGPTCSWAARTTWTWCRPTSPPSACRGPRRRSSRCRSCSTSTPAAPSWCWPPGDPMYSTIGLGAHPACSATSGCACCPARRRSPWPAPGWAGRSRTPRWSASSAGRWSCCTRYVQPGRRLLVLGSDDDTPSQVAGAARRPGLRAEPDHRPRRARRAGRGGALGHGRDVVAARPPRCPSRPWSAAPTAARCRCRRRPVCPTAPTSPTGSSSTPRSGRSAWPGSPRCPVSRCGTSAPGSGSIGIEWMRVAQVVPGGGRRGGGGAGGADRAQRHPAGRARTCG